MASGALIAILIIFVLLAAGGGYYYYYYYGTSNTMTGTSNTMTDTSNTMTDTPKTDTPTVGGCDGTVAIRDDRSCMDGTGAGIQWLWTDSNCQATASYWIVEAVSGWDSTFKIKTRIPGTDLSTGFNKVFDKFTNGAQITFTAMPYDKTDKPMLSAPLTTTVDNKGSGATCASTGTKLTDAVPNWNENKNLLKVTQYNLGGGNQSGYTIGPAGEAPNAWPKGWDDKRVDRLNRNKLYNKSVDAYVPKGYGYDVECEAGKTNGKTWSELLQIANGTYQVTTKGTCFGGGANNCLTYGVAAAIPRCKDSKNKAMRSWTSGSAAEPTAADVKAAVDATYTELNKMTDEQLATMAKSITPFRQAAQSILDARVAAKAEPA